MKLDDPKLTAFALGELTPAEQAEVDQLLRADHEIAAEIEEAREVSRILRTHLAAEPGGALAEHQRDAIFREARLLELESRAGEGSAEPFMPLVVPRAAWWNRPGPWQAIAACAVAGFAAYALFVNIGGHRGGLARTDSGEIVVRVPTDDGMGRLATDGPNLLSPNSANPENRAVTAGIGTPKALLNPPPIAVQPSVVIESRPAVPASETAGDSPDQAKPKGPRVVGNGNGNDWRAGASIGRPGSKTPTLAEEKFAAMLSERKSEADALHVGSSYADFARVYRPSGRKAGQFEMIATPGIKVDADFVDADGKAAAGAIPPDARVKRLSKPYLE